METNAMQVFHSVMCCSTVWAALLLLTTLIRLPAREPQKATLPVPTVEKARLLPGKYAAVEPALAADGQGRVVVTAIDWSKLTELKPRATQILVWRSEDSGRTWLAPFYLNQSPQFGTAQADPWLQCVGPQQFSIVYMAGSSELSGALAAAVFQRSEDGGKNWTEPHAFHPRVDKTVIAVGPSRQKLGATFTTLDRDGNGVQVHQSSDQGKTWQKVPVPFLANSDQYSAFGMVVTDEGAIAIGWRVQDGKRLLHVLTTTTNGGKDWKKTELSAMPSDRYTELEYTGPALALDDAGRAYVLSVRLEKGKGNLDILLRSTRDFQTWSDPVVLAREPEAEFRGYPAIAARGSRIHVAWMERKEKKYHVWYRGSDDGGKTWSDRLLLSQPEPPSDLLTAAGFKETLGHYMSLTDDGAGGVHAVWGVGTLGARPERAEIWYNVIRWTSHGK
jgi:hypothetical protein